MNLRSSCLLAVAVLFAAPELYAICAKGPGGPRLIRARIDACRIPEQEIRKAMEPYRAHHEAWLAGFPENVRAARNFDRGVENRIERGEAVATVTVLQFRRLSDEPRIGTEVTAGPWQSPEKAEIREYLVRTSPEGCQNLAPGTEHLFLDDWTCCDTRPSSDNACLLDLPALEMPSGAIETKYGAPGT